MSKKEEITALVDEIIKYYCQLVSCMRLMVEKGDSNYDGMDIEEPLAIFEKRAEGWIAARKKLDLIEDGIIDNCSEEYLCVSELIRDRDNVKKSAKLSQDICKSLYGCYYGE